MRRRKFTNIFDSMTEFGHLKNAFYGACQGKKSRLTVMSFEVSLERNLLSLHQELRDGTYQFGPYRSFYVTEPKRRLIESACFRDRVVHHAICNKLNPIFFPKFYQYSFACLPGRGTHSAMLTLQKWINTSRRKYYLKCDIRKYFPSVRRDILFALLQKSLADERLLKLLEGLIHTAPQTGIPIGNLTSQLFANIYLNELDQFVKRELREPYYVRYMDDFILLTDSAQASSELRKVIEDFVVSKLKLEMSPEKVRIGRVEEGLPFVGYCLRRNSVRVRGASLRRCRKKVFKAYRSSFQRKNVQLQQDWATPLVRQSLFYRSWSSFVGQTRYADDSFYIQNKLLKEIEKYSSEKRTREGGI